MTAPQFINSQALRQDSELTGAGQAPMHFT